MGKLKFTAEQVEKALRESRGLVSIAAAKLQCDDQTVRNYMVRYPSVKRAVFDNRERLVDSAELRLVEAVEKKGEPWAIAMVLKTLGKKRGYVERNELSGPDGGPMETVAKHEHRFDFESYKALFDGAESDGGPALPPADGAGQPLDPPRSDTEARVLPYRPEA